MKKITIALLTLILLVSGCISQVYYHKVNDDGSSTIEQTTDYSQMIAKAGTKGMTSQLALDNAKNAFDRICKTTKMKCKYDETSITLSDSIGKENELYVFESSQDLFKTDYKIKINKIPRQNFDTALQKGQTALDKNLPLTFRKQDGPDLDLSNKEENAKLAMEIKNNGASAKYTIEFPADIKSANAGNYSGVVNGKKVEFDLAELLSDSAPIVIESEQFNPALFIVIVLLILLAYLWVKFSRVHDNRLPSSEKPLNPPRSRRIKK